MLLGAEVFSWFCISGYSLIYLIAKHSFSYGENLTNIINLTYELVFPNYIIDNILHIRSIINTDHDYFSFIHNIFEKPKSNIEQISYLNSVISILSSSFLFIIFLSIISYCLSIFFVGQTISFLIFKKLTDDDDILRRSRDEKMISFKNDSFE